MKMLLRSVLLSAVLSVGGAMIFAGTNQPGTPPEKLSDPLIREFHQAIGAGDRRTVEKMIRDCPELISARLPDSDPARQTLPVFTAVDHGQTDVLAILLQHGSHCFNDITQQTALDRAAVFGTVAVASMLVDSGENVDGLVDPSNLNDLERLSRGTPLRDAISCRHPEIARALVLRGAHIDIYSAAGMGWTGWVTRQVSVHPDQTDEADDWHYTPLSYAVAGGASGAAEVLLSHGADVSLRYDDGGTLLQMAASYGFHDVIAVLLAHGADVNAKNKAGDTAVDCAIQHNQLDAADLLRDHGGKRGIDLAR